MKVDLEAFTVVDLFKDDEFTGKSSSLFVYSVFTVHAILRIYVALACSTYRFHSLLKNQRLFKKKLYSYVIQTLK